MFIYFDKMEWVKQMKGENRILKKAQILMIGNTIRFNNTTIQISNISQIRTGNLLINQRFVYDTLILLTLVLIGFDFLNSIFMAVAAITISAIMMAYKYFFKSKCQCLHLEISSGEGYSFVSEDFDFINEVYELISEIMAENRDTVDYTISFKGDGEIINNLETIEEYGLKTQRVSRNNKKTNNNPKISINEQELINSSLMKLQSNYKEKNENSMEIINFVENIIQLVNKNDKVGVKKAFGEFVSLGLINDCNELGLNELIDEIKKNIY